MARGDLTDDQWSRLEPLLPPIPKMGRPARDRRQCFDVIWWRARTGPPWRDIPERYGPGEAAYMRFRRWQIDGTWALILKKLQVRADTAGHIEWGCPSTPRSAGPTSTRSGPEQRGSRFGPDGPGWAGCRAGRPRPRTLARRPDHETSPGRGRLVPTSWRPWSPPDSAAIPPVFTEVMNRIRITRPAADAHVFADRACSSRSIREYLRRRQIAHTIPEKRDQAGHRLRRGSAGTPAADRDLHVWDAEIRGRTRGRSRTVWPNALR
ncbi:MULTISPECIES: transposase [unclassified Streptomyces]|uniref:transposase n=1 Tax=unclassified Streptomyces TaxID=2593676 RepID=UPI0037F3CA4A